MGFGGVKPLATFGFDDFFILPMQFGVYSWYMFCVQTNILGVHGGETEGENIGVPPAELLFYYRRLYADINLVLSRKSSESFLSVGQIKE